MNKKKILKEFKELNCLDFRLTKYYIFSCFYNAKNSVYFDYDFAKKIVLDLNNFLTKKFGEKLVIYNLQMDIDSLRNQSLKNYVESRIDQYFFINNVIIKFGKETY